MPEGPLGFPRLTNIGPLVEKTKWEKINEDVTPDVDVFFHSSENMKELDDESVHLVVTSPPYNIGWDYGSVDDQKEYQNYLDLLDRVFNECYRVLTEQGRLCINVPTLVRQGSEGGVSHFGDVVNILREQDNDWRFRESIVWDKTHGSGRGTRYSSFPDPWGVLLVDQHEAIMVMQKPGRRRTVGNGGDRPRPDSPLRDLSRIDPDEEPNDIIHDVWHIPTVQESIETAEGERIPTYPKEIPERLIKLYTYVGDTVLDPFLGAGTTLDAAEDLGRDGVGYEIREELAGVIEKTVGVRMEFKER